jgi:hypothetical protein
MLDWLGGHGSITGERTVNTLFRDVIMGALGAIMLALVILVFHINPPKKEDADNQRSRGNMRVEVQWPNEMDVDVDTWVQAPGDTPVGYSNLNGRVFNLVRDDLGTHADLTGMNYEVAFSRGIPAGEWVINLHWFSNSMGVVEVPVKVLITMKKLDDGSSKEASISIMSKSVTLVKVGQELTVIRFMLDEYQDVDKTSFTTELKLLRSAPDDHDGGM